MVDVAPYPLNIDGLAPGSGQLDQVPQLVDNGLGVLVARWATLATAVNDIAPGSGVLNQVVQLADDGAGGLVAHWATIATGSGWGTIPYNSTQLGVSFDPLKTARLFQWGTATQDYLQVGQGTATANQIAIPGIIYDALTEHVFRLGSVLYAKLSTHGGLPGWLFSQARLQFVNTIGTTAPGSLSAPNKNSFLFFESPSPAVNVTSRALVCMGQGATCTTGTARAGAYVGVAGPVSTSGGGTTVGNDCKLTGSMKGNGVEGNVAVGFPIAADIENTDYPPQDAGGGKAVMVLNIATTAPTRAPTTGVVLWNDGTHLFMWAANAPAFVQLG